MTLKLPGDRPKIQALVDLLSPHGILEVVRTGLIGLHRGDQNILTQEEI